MYVKKLFVGALLASTGFAGAAAQAQTTPATTATAQADPQSGDIVVTARARSESLQKVPDSITALSGALIEKAGIQNVQDAARFVPNFDFKEGFRAGSAQITVRGLTTPQGGDLPIAVVVDGVQLPGVDFFNQDLLDVESIQVLRGPQGALYGQGALAGAMLITTRKPTDNFEFNGKASYGTGDTYHLVGSVSGPLVKDALYFRVVGSYRNSDGTIKNVAGKGVNFIDEKFVRAELRYDTGGSFRATLAGNFTKAHDGAIYQDIAPKSAAGVVQIDDFANGPQITSNTPGYENRKIYGGSLRLEQNLGGGVLSSTTSADRLTDFTFGDADWTAANRLSQANVYNVKLFNEDFRYTSNSALPLRYVFGAFYQNRIIDEALDVAFLPGSGLTGFAVHTRDQQKRRSWAVFGQLNYDITRKLELTGALRYDANHAEFDNIYTGARLSDNFNKPQPKVSLAYKWTPHFMTYATFAIGYRSGGFNSASSVFAGPIIGAETSRDYEIGFKAQMFNGLASVQGSLFRIDLEHGQFFFTSQTPQSQNTINIDKSHINGAELELQLHPVRHFELNGSLGITHAVIDNFNGTGLDNNSPFPNVPSYTAKGSASYEIELGDSYSLTPRVDVYNRGREYFFPARVFRSGSYTDTDLRLELAAPKWSLTGFVANLSDERHTEITNNTGVRTPNEGRTYGVEFAVHFR